MHTWVALSLLNFSARVLDTTRLIIGLVIVCTNLTITNGIQNLKALKYVTAFYNKPRNQGNHYKKYQLS